MSLFIYSGKDHFKTKRIRKDNKVFGLYRSMIEKEAEKINSAVLKYIIMFVVIISIAGVMFKFVFLNMILVWVKGLLRIHNRK